MVDGIEVLRVLQGSRDLEGILGAESDDGDPPEAG